MEEEVAQRLANLEREIVSLRMTLNDIKGMIAGLSGDIDRRAMIPTVVDSGRKTIADYYRTIMPD
jgi:Mg2+ and Co2+ transporter CorA